MNKWLRRVVGLFTVASLSACGGYVEGGRTSTSEIPNPGNATVVNPEQKTKDIWTTRQDSEVILGTPETPLFP